MTFSKSILLLIALSTIAALVACGGSSSNNPPPPPPAISVAFNPAAPASLQIGAQASLTAVVSNDSASGGVNWTATCGSADCGQFSSATTASGTPTTYTAPATMPSGGTVNVKATSVTDATKSASATITIAAPKTLADGNYVFSLFGADVITDVYSVSGVFTIANGAITGGEQDFVDFANFTESDLINPVGSSMTTAADGNLQIILATCLGVDCTQADTNVGVAGVETLAGSILPLNPNKALITEFDASASGSGEISLQDPAAIVTPSGGYAFGLNGRDFNGCPAAFGGVINVDGSGGNISGAGSIFDANDCATPLQAETFTASTVSAPDAMGRVVFTLNPADTANFLQIVLVGYIVDANQIHLVEGFDSFSGTTGGTAFSQGANTGTFTGTSVSGSSYVVGLTGFDVPFALQVAGLFTFNSDGSISGFINYNDHTGTAVQAPAAITGGTWIEDAVTGRISLTGVTDGVATFDAEAALDGNGHLLALSMDLNSDVIQGRGFQQSGGGTFTSGSFSGAYALGVTGIDINFGDELDAVGPVVADGGGTFTGFTDLNWLFSTGPGPTFSNAPVSGTFTAAANGVFTGTVTGVDVTSCTAFNASGTGCTADAFTYYLIDATGDNIAIQTDPSQVTLGYFVQQ